MISRIEIENFYSVRQSQALDLSIAENAPNIPGRFAEGCVGSRERLPKVVALFGANASGKSTVLRALAFLSWFVQHSFRLPPDAAQPCDCFHDHKAIHLPTRLAIHFSAPANLMHAQEGEEAKYIYEVRFENENGRPRSVASESLRQQPARGGKSVRFFERVAKDLAQSGGWIATKDDIRFGKRFGLSGYNQVLPKVRTNASLISTLAQFDHGPSLALQRLAASIITNILVEKIELPEADIVRLYAENPAILTALNAEIQRIDLGIKAMSIDSTGGIPAARFEHQGLAGLMPMQLESHGTRQFVRIFPLLIQTISSGGVAVIDEFDLAIHPTVLPEILRWFYDPVRNPHNAQLWMSCQNASLLDDLVKEEIYFCEKDSGGRTSIYGLQDVQSVRRNDNYYQKYLGGVYGAVPQLG